MPCSKFLKPLSYTRKKILYLRRYPAPASKEK
jgi:hypothetical protein